MLVEHARPWWLAAAALLQVCTYVCAGGVWALVLRAAGHRQPIRMLARLSVEKLSINQLLPSSGLMGNMVVVLAMRRRGVPASVAMETLVIDMLSHYAAFALAAVATVSLLWARHDLTPLLLALVAVFAVVIVCIPLGIAWALAHRDWQPPRWIAKRRTVRSLLDGLAQIETDRVRSPSFLVRSGLLQIGIFLLDSLTLWAMLRATGTAVSPLVTFAALVVGSMASSVSFVPGGIGSFEAGCTGTLALLGVPVEAALTGTLLLRGLSLWIPLLPGFLLARKDIAGA
jgi:uncharacterized protein (TIRG00374 family)